MTFRTRQRTRAGPSLFREEAALVLVFQSRQRFAALDFATIQ
jgi:hypothetical protein